MMRKALETVIWTAVVLLLFVPQQAWCADLKAGITAYESGDYDQAIGLINQYLQEKPRDEKGYYYLGNCHFQKGELDQAIEQYQRALDIKSKYWEAYYQLGRVYLEKEMILSARELEGRPILVGRDASWYILGKDACAVEVHFYAVIASQTGLEVPWS